MQNPVTGSGGMLIGRVAEIGPEHPARAELRRGDRIATLVSLALTPLVLDEIQAGHPHAERVDVKGSAVLFASGLWARMPEDLPEAMALAVLDVCGAPAWVARLASKGQRVLVLGAGKSGSLACAQAHRNGAQVTALDYRRDAAQALVSDGLADAWLAADATRPLEVYAQRKGEVDVVVNCARGPGTETASILSTRPGGAGLFLSLAAFFRSPARCDDGGRT